MKKDEQCVICNSTINGLQCSNEHCLEDYIKCKFCKIITNKICEYRGQISCSSCFEVNVEDRGLQRNEIIKKQDQVDKLLVPLVRGFADNSKLSKQIRREYAHRKSLAKETIQRKIYEKGD